ncbi:MAG TPA: carboxyl transferase domain-containing protein [Thermoanaerobaculia bacterium]|nr:carboxyl transferase domain-containing protein [Thermoanaerobaculia bacterium]
MSWRPEVDEIERRKRLAQELGGAEAVERQHASGRLTIRERVERLVDPGSFHETGPHAGFAELDEQGKTTSFEPANYVLGVGRIDGRPCVVGGEDFTQRGGSPSTAGFRKSVYAEEMACRLRLPLVRFLEGGGGSVRGSSKRSAPAPASDPVYATHRFVSIARALRTAPVVSAGLGAVAGLPAARLAASHLAIMTRATSQVLIGGPALVERALGERKTKEELGGAQVHGKSGVVDLVVETEDDVFGAIRRFLSYLPTRVGELAPRATPFADDRPGRIEEELLEIVPRDRRRLYDMRRLLGLVFDLGSLYEMSRFYGRSQITALARLDGWPVGVFANDPNFQGGAMGAEDAQKVRRFLQLCQRFHLPILSFVDEPGFMIGSQAEAAGTIRYGVEAICAAVETTVPWATVHVRKAYGVASAAHFGPGGHVLTWPSAESGPLPLEGGIAVAFKREIAAAPDPDAKRRELEETFAKARSPFPRAESFSVHDLIDPRDTRPELCRWLELARPQLEREARRRWLDRDD